MSIIILIVTKMLPHADSFFVKSYWCFHLPCLTAIYIKIALLSCPDLFGLLHETSKKKKKKSWRDILSRMGGGNMPDKLMYTRKYHLFIFIKIIK